MCCSCVVVHSLTLGSIAAVARRPYESRESHNELSHCSHQSSKHSIAAYQQQNQNYYGNSLPPRGSGATGPVRAQAGHLVYSAKRMQFGKNDHFISGTFPVSTLHQMRVRGVQIESRFGCVAHRRFFCPVFQFQFCPT